MIDKKTIALFNGLFAQRYKAKQMTDDEPDRWTENYNRITGNKPHYTAKGWSDGKGYPTGYEDLTP